MDGVDVGLGRGVVGEGVSHRGTARASRAVRGRVRGGQRPFGVEIVSGLGLPPLALDLDQGLAPSLAAALPTHLHLDHTPKAPREGVGE